MIKHKRFLLFFINVVIDIFKLCTLISFYSGELILSNDRPQSIHADIMHTSTIHPPPIDRPSHSPTSFSLTTASIEFSDMQQKKSESHVKDHDIKVQDIKIEFFKPIGIKIEIICIKSTSIYIKSSFGR